jgi:hypothetical protein
MLNEQINRRATVFINENRMMNNQDLAILNPIMQEFALLPSTNKQMNLQITPNGLQPIEGLSIELRSNNDSFIISFGQGRIDILRNKISMGDNLEPINDFIVRVQRIISMLTQAYPTWTINRLALCLNVCFDLDVEHLVSSYHKFVVKDSPNTVEWRLRNVIRKPLSEEIPILVNQVSTVSRSFFQTSFEQLPLERILVETDFNTVMGQEINFNPELIAAVWEATKTDTLLLIEEYNRLLTE